MVKLLHLADVHLGGRFYAATDALLKRARSAARTALRRAVGCALREEADAVLIAGNLFDGRYLDYEAEDFLAEQFARLSEAGVACFYATGPDDPGPRDVLFEKVPGLHRFDAAAPRGVLLEDADGQPLARVVGAGFGPDPAGAPPADPFPDPEDEVPHVGLLHAALPEEETESALPAPLRQAMPQDGGYAYWALGGALGHQQLTGASDTAWYAGPTVPRRPVQAGLQGGLLVTLREGEVPQVSFRPFAPLCWADLALDGLEDVRTQHALLQRARRAFEAARDERTSCAWLARVTLTGECPLAASLREDAARQKLEAALAEHLDLEAAFVRLGRLTPPADPARHRDEPHVLHEALALIEQAEDDPALLHELAPGVLAAGPASGEVEAYLQERLGALDREACARLLRDGQGA